METTNGIGQLIAALAKAQAKFETPRKNKVAKVRSEKGSYEYRYSDLADLIAAVRGPLSENELAFTHRFVPAERGTIVCTILAHSSGEMLTSEYLIPHFQRQQEFGSALTYAKRYSLSSLLGVAADDDDDGNMADARDRPQPQEIERAPHPRKAEAADAYARIKGAMNAATTPKMIDELIKANSDVFMPIIKEALPDHYEALMTLASARKTEMYSSA